VDKSVSTVAESGLERRKLMDGGVGAIEATGPDRQFWAGIDSTGNACIQIALGPERLPLYESNV
jgi:hypothetical protein